MHAGPILPRNDAPIDRSMFERVRESGRAVVATAAKLPVVLADERLPIDALSELVTLIDARRVEIKSIAGDVRNERLRMLAHQIENLWCDLAKLATNRLHRGYSVHSQ